jgi:hypothetical protein
MSKPIGSKNLTAEWQTICYFHTKFGVYLIKATQKIRVSLTTHFYHNMTLTFDLDLEMVPSMKFLTLWDNYTRDVILM